jgi:hypothetical protein
LAEFLESIDQYYASFSKLTDAIGKAFGVPHLYPDYDIADLEIPVTNIQEIEEQQIDEQRNTVLRNILRHKAWPSNAIYQPGELYYQTLALRTLLSPNSTINIVIMRYATVVSRFQVNDKVDDLKKYILNKIITNVISEHVSFMFKEMEKINSLYQTNRLDTRFAIDDVINRFVENAFQSIMYVLDDRRPLNNTFIEKEAIDTLASLLSVSKPSLEYVDGVIEDIKEHESDRGGALLEHDRKIITVFEQYKERKNKENVKSTNSTSSTS